MKKVTTEQIRQQLQEETNKQVALCVKELNAVVEPILNKYNCRYDVSVVLRANQIIPRIAVVPVNA